jgi:hypothetical protein
MDWERSGRWDAQLAVTAAPNLNDRVVWRVTKDTRWAEARIREVAARP